MIFKIISIVATNEKIFNRIVLNKIIKFWNSISYMVYHIYHIFKFIEWFQFVDGLQ